MIKGMILSDLPMSMKVWISIPTQSDSAAFSPDGKKIAFGSTDGTILIWDNPSLQQLIDDARERFKDYPLTPEERRKYYLE